MENEPEKQVSKTIEDTKLIESLSYVKKNNLMSESNSTIKFETVKEAEDSAKEDIGSAIIEKTTILKQDISELQKAGYELKLSGIELIKIPLKTKVWLATLDRKDLEPIFNLQKKVRLFLNPLKEEHDKKVAEKDRLEKVNQQKESKE